MAGEALKLLMEVNEPMYAEGSPVLLEACALQADTAQGRRTALLKWVNLDTRSVRALSVTLYGFDSCGNRLPGIKYRYEGLNAALNGKFGSEVAIPLGDAKAERFTVELDEVEFGDRSFHKAYDKPLFEKLPESKPIRFGKLNNQYLQDLVAKGYTYSGMNLPQQTRGLWQCGCGHWNKTGNCRACSATLRELRQIGNPDTLRKNFEASEHEKE